MVKTTLPDNSQLLVASGASDCDQLQLNWNSKGFPFFFFLQDSGRWSVAGDDDSSGVFSYNSQDIQSFSRDWLSPTHQPPPRCFEGVLTNSDYFKEMLLVQNLKLNQ